MSKFKKVTSLLLGAALAISLTACGTKSTTNSKQASSEDYQEFKKSVLEKIMCNN